MSLIQEYYAGPGTGKTRFFIPFQIKLNQELGCDHFLVVSRDENLKKNIKAFHSKNPMGTNSSRPDVEVFDISKYFKDILVSRPKMTSEIQGFLSTARATTNIIIDESQFVFDDNETFVKDLFRGRAKIYHRNRPSDSIFHERS